MIIEKSGGGEKQPVGRAVLFEKEDGEYSFSNFTSVLRIKNNEELLSKFLYIYLLFIYKRGDTLSMQRATTGIHNIEFDKYLSIKIPCISLSEQQRIVSRLDSAFAHIDELKANAEKQLSEARTLFQKALTKAMEPKEGWEEFIFSEIIKLQSGDYLSSKDYVNGEYPVYGGNGITGYHNQYNKNGNIIVVGRVGALCGNVHYIDNPIWLTDNGFEVIVKKNIDINMKFLCCYLEYMDLGKYARQTAQPVISNSSLKEIPLYIPPLTEQQRIVSRLDSLSAHVRELEEVTQKTIAECDALKQALLRKVFE